MAGVTAPPGATRIEETPKAATLTKLVACMDALGMQPSIWRLGGGQLAVFGMRSELMLAIEARFDMGETPTGKVSAKFAGAKVHDPIGIVRNLEFDYSINKPNAKRLMLSETEAKLRGDARNREYNDGGQHRFIVADMATASEMWGWIDEWLDVLKIEHKRASSKPRQTRAESNEQAILSGGAWVG